MNTFYQRPAELAEYRLIEQILTGIYPPGSQLQAERELAASLGVTRPTLREALQRLARDGWLEIHQGKPTRICNYLQEGNLAVLSAIAARQDDLPSGFVANLLSVRCLLAGEYARLAVARNAGEAASYLNRASGLVQTAEAFTAYDWGLHRLLTTLSGNPVFTLILNGFKDLYLIMGRTYFSYPAARKHSDTFYSNLLGACQNQDPEAAGQITQLVMEESLELANQFFSSAD